MSIRIKYEDDAISVPARIVPVLDRAGANDLRLLMALCADRTLRDLADNDYSAFAAVIRCTEAQAAASLAFWRGAGVMETDRTTGAASIAEGPVRTSTTRPQDPAGPLPSGEQAGLAGQAAGTVGSTNTSGMREAQPADITTGETARNAGGETAVRTAGGSKPTRHDQLPAYTTEQIASMLEERPEAAEFLNESQRVWGKMFNTHEINIILGLVDYLGLDWEYVLILLAYCKKLAESRGIRKSLHYVETVAFDFYDDGVCDPASLQDAIRRMEMMAETEGQLRSMFGMGSRSLTPNEKKYFSTWLYDYHYTLDIIRLAYDMTVDAIGEPKPRYMHSILSKWNSQSLHSIDEIRAFATQDAARHGKKQGKGDTAQKVGSSFETDDFFGAAVRRSFGDDFDPGASGR